MTVSRGLRRQQAASAHAAEHVEFEHMLLASLEDPAFAEAVFTIPAVAEAVAGIAETVLRPARQRKASRTAASASSARQLKAARLTARGRGRRG